MWENSRQQRSRHEHTLVANSSGQQVCSSCQRIVFNPITESSDPRLQGAGAMRSPRSEEPFSVPLPEILIWLDGYPVPYLSIVFEEHQRRGTAGRELWLALDYIIYRSYQ